MKTNNWQKNVKEGYNTRSTPVETSQSEPTRLPGKTVTVTRDDVNGALRKLKKILERDDRQKDLAKHEYYEKPSVKRKRLKDTAKANWNRRVDEMRKTGEWVDQGSSDLSWLKSKRKRRAKVDLSSKLARLKLTRG
jgi:ribosomal protein S21